MIARTGPQHVYVACVSLVSLFVLARSLPHVSLTGAVVAALAVLVAESFSVTIRDNVHVSLVNIVFIVIVIVAGAATAVVAALGIMPSVLLRASKQNGLKAFFNTAQFALSAAAAGVSYLYLLSVMGAAFPSPLGIIAALVATLMFTLVNLLMVSGIVSAASPDAFWPTLRTTLPAFVVQVPSAFALAVLSALLLLQSPWAVLFMAVPVLVARYALMAFEQLDEAYDELVRGFVNAIEMKDLYTRGHSERVSQLSVLVAEELGISYDERRLTGYAALLHDVGKVGVSLCIINKPGPLDDAEFEEIKKHPTIGANVLRDIDFLEPAIDIVRYHHERLDGRGYPHGVDEQHLSRLVRIVTAVDAFDAMTSTRSYRRALSIEEAIAELERCAGAQFDPEVVVALAACVRRLDWQPTVDFASEAALHGAEIPNAPVGELRRSRGALPLRRERRADASSARASRPWGTS